MTGERPTSVTEGVTIPDLLVVDGGEHSAVRRLAWGLGAAACFVLGIVGWLVPVVTGVPFYVLGAVLLAKAWPRFGHWLNERERRWPLRQRLWLRPRLRAAHKREQAGHGEPSEAPGTQSPPSDGPA